MHQALSWPLIAIMVLTVILALAVHEVAHGWVAERLGDDTARRAGRLTLNPLAHVDWIGTVLLPLGLYFTVGLVFGWAKPVPVVYQRLHRPKTDMAWVALAGPASNLAQVLVWALVLKLALLFDVAWLVQTAQLGVWINLLIMLVNLVPFPPLDGSRVLAAVLPDRAAEWINRVQYLGIALLVALLLSDWGQNGLLALISGAYQGVMRVFGL